MKAVRSVEGSGAVDLDEPPGVGELLDMRATSICGSDLSYIRFGSRAILGHELAACARTARGRRRGHLRRMECLQCLRGAYTVPDPRAACTRISADGGMAEQFRAPSARLVPSRRVGRP